MFSQNCCAFTDTRSELVEDSLCRAAVHHLNWGERLPLETDLREKMEALFSCDLTKVRIITECEGLRGFALAVAAGKTILFAPGMYRPNEAAGLQILAHEICHVLQQHSLPLAPCSTLLKNQQLEDQANLLAASLADPKWKSSLAHPEFHSQCMEKEIGSGVLQPILVIDDPNATYRLLAEQALEQLTGNIDNGLNFVDRNLWWTWVEVQAGPNIANCRAARPLGTALVEAVINNAYVARIVNTALGNSASPERTSLLQGGPNLDYLRTQDQVLGRSVSAGYGSSCRIDWNGGAVDTMDLGPANHIQPIACPSYIALAHELIHADRCARGIVAGKRDDNVYVLIDQRPHKNHAAWATPLGMHVHHEGNRWFLKATELMEEVVTVGIPLPLSPAHQPNLPMPAHPLGITENSIRGENGLRQRVKYGDMYEAKPTSARYIGNV